VLIGDALYTLSKVYSYTGRDREDRDTRLNVWELAGR